MVTVPVIDMENKGVGEFELPSEIGDVVASPRLVHEALLTQLTNRRRGTASTKTRAFVQGSKKKPFQQKGTGRARQGHSRSPLLWKGAVAFGPLPREFNARLPRKARKKALCSVISDKIREGRFLVVDALRFESGKTKQVASWLKRLDVSTALIVHDPADSLSWVAARNIPTIKLVSPNAVTLFDVMRHDFLIASRERVEQLISFIQGKGATRG